MADLQGTFFGLQLAVRTSKAEPWRQKLCEVVRDNMRDMSTIDHRGFYGAVTNLLLEASDRIAVATWDFVADGGGEFDDWVRGIEDDVSTPWVQDPSGAAMDHVLVSVFFLLQKNGPSARLCGDRCDLPESTWNARSTYRLLLETIPQLDHRSIVSDAVYVTPGSIELGFSLSELRGDDYDYLNPVR